MKEEQNAKVLTYQKDLKNESQLHKKLSKAILMKNLVLYSKLCLIIGQPQIPVSKNQIFVMIIMRH